MDEVNERKDREITLIRFKSDSLIVAISKEVQAELRKQSALTAKLSKKASENQVQKESSTGICRVRT